MDTQRLDLLEERLLHAESRLAEANRRIQMLAGLALLLLVTGSVLLTRSQASAQGGRTRDTAGDIAALQYKTQFISIVASPDVAGANEMRITGTNLCIVNGNNESTANGLGNLIVGYNETRAALGAGGSDVRTGSHNLILGAGNNYSAYGGAIFGFTNSIGSPYATVTGGYINSASGAFSSISGGAYNSASQTASSISGGYSNTASGILTSILGGNSHTVNPDYGTSYVGP